jgi:5-methylcytosine-specific restriction endonuclease McrA
MPDYLTGEYLEEFNRQRERVEAWYACDHPQESLEYRWRVFKSGTTHVCVQCSHCGANLGGVKKSTFSPGGLASLPPYDEDLQEQRYQEMRQALERRREALLAKQQEAQSSRDGAWWHWYNQYLTSPEWRQRREAVLRRAGGYCEGCGANAPAQIHHLTYEHVGNEFLFELVAVCVACHERLHEEKQSGAAD